MFRTGPDILALAADMPEPATSTEDTTVAEPEGAEAPEVSPESGVGSEPPEGAEPVEGYAFTLVFTWTLPPLPRPPDLLVLATELAGVGGVELPLEISAIDSFAAVTDAPERSLSIVSRVEVGLDRIFLGQEQMCDVLETCHNVSSWLLERSGVWLGDA